MNKVAQLNRISLELLWSLLKVYRCLGYSEHIGPRPWYSVSLWWTMCLPPAHVTNTQSKNTLNKTQQNTTLGSFSFWKHRIIGVWQCLRNKGKSYMCYWHNYFCVLQCFDCGSRCYYVPTSWRKKAWSFFCNLNIFDISKFTFEVRRT